MKSSVCYLKAFVIECLFVSSAVSAKTSSEMQPKSRFDKLVVLILLLSSSSQAASDHSKGIILCVSFQKICVSFVVVFYPNQ